MKKYAMYVGIDVSKSKLDVSFFVDFNTAEVHHFIVSNDKKGIKNLIDAVKKQKISLDKVLFCQENTGVYSMPLCLYFSENNLDHWVVPAIEIKRSKGIARGKNDKTDAKDIAFYAYTHLHKLVLSRLPEKDIQRIKLLFTERDKVLKAIRLFDSTKESKDYLPKDITKVVMCTNAKILKDLKRSLKQIDSKMQEVIKENPVIKQQYQLIQSIPGVGTQTTVYLIAATRCFQSFSDWRKLACYAGVAPFEYSSGSSIKGRTKVNHMADKKMKSLLNMCALSAKKHDTQLKEYYERKVKEGKNPMLVMNNLRCKILSRVFAVVNRQTPFVNINKFAA